jgi:hypothetical protein
LAGFLTFPTVSAGILSIAGEIFGELERDEGEKRVFNRNQENMTKTDVFLTSWEYPT